MVDDMKEMLRDAVPTALFALLVLIVMALVIPVAMLFAGYVSWLWEVIYG